MNREGSRMSKVGRTSKQTADDELEKNQPNILQNTPLITRSSSYSDPIKALRWSFYRQIKISYNDRYTDFKTIISQLSVGEQKQSVLWQNGHSTAENEGEKNGGNFIF